jgi:hypothetical protein
MEILVILVVVALSLSLAFAGAGAVLWAVFYLMTAMQSRTTAPLPDRVASEEMPIAAQLAA